MKAGFTPEGGREDGTYVVNHPILVRYQWSIDKLTITDGFGKQLSFCKELGELLPSGIPVARKLKLGDCLTVPHKPDFPLLLDKVGHNNNINCIIIITSLSVAKEATNIGQPPATFARRHQQAP